MIILALFWPARWALILTFTYGWCKLYILYVFQDVKHRILFLLEMFEPFLDPAITPMKSPIAFGNLSPVFQEQQAQTCGIAINVIRTAVRKPAVLPSLESEWRRGSVAPRRVIYLLLNFLGVSLRVKYFQNVNSLCSWKYGDSCCNALHCFLPSKILLLKDFSTYYIELEILCNAEDAALEKAEQKERFIRPSLVMGIVAFPK